MLQRKLDLMDGGVGHANSVISKKAYLGENRGRWKRWFRKRRNRWNRGRGSGLIAPQQIRVPKPYSKIAAPTSDVSSVKREMHARDVVGMAKDWVGNFPGGEVPDLHDGIWASGGEKGAIWGDCDRSDDVCMGLHRVAYFLSGDGVPDAYGAIVGRGYEALTVGCVDDASHVVVVAFHWTDEHLADV